MKNSQSSRNLSIFEFFENLQKEYICAEIRTKIFQKKYVPYWENAMLGKKKKIEDIGSKNRLETIFSSKDEYLRVFSGIIPEWGEPVFCYRDSAQKDKLEKWDRVFFYNRDSEVRIQNEDSSNSIGYIADNSMVMNELPLLSVRVRDKKKFLLVPLKRVMRIL